MLTMVIARRCNESGYKLMSIVTHRKPFFLFKSESYSGKDDNHTSVFWRNLVHHYLFDHLDLVERLNVLLGYFEETLFTILYFLRFIVIVVVLVQFYLNFGCRHLHDNDITMVLAIVKESLIFIYIHNWNV